MYNIIECFAILLIIGAMTVIYMRACKKQMALAMLPLVFVPFMHIVAWIIGISLKSEIFVRSSVYIICDIIGLTATAVMSGICSLNFKKKVAVVYLSVVVLFSIALTAILIIDSLQF